MICLDDFYLAIEEQKDITAKIKTARGFEFVKEQAKSYDMYQPISFGMLFGQQLTHQNVKPKRNGKMSKCPHL